MTVPRLEPANSDFARRVQDSFARQGAMHTLGAELSLLEPGAVDVCLDWAPGLTQQHGFCMPAWFPRRWIPPAATQG